MRVIIILLLCLAHLAIHSQQTCKGLIIDSLTKAPVEFANIGIPGKGIGTVSNEKGEFSFEIPDSVAGEKIKISLIGYKTKAFFAGSIKSQNTILLAQSSVNLNEVSITAQKTRVKILGNETKTRTVGAGFTKNNLGAELATKLNIKHPQTHIRKFMLNVNINKLNTAPVFRLNIYKVDENGKPGENILNQNVIIAPKELTGLIEVDLTPYHVFVDDDVFISVEWIKDLGDVKGLYFSSKLIGTSTYYRQVSQDKWQKLTSVGIGLHAEVAY